MFCIQFRKIPTDLTNCDGFFSRSFRERVRPVRLLSVTVKHPYGCFALVPLSLINNHHFKPKDFIYVTHPTALYCAFKLPATFALV